MYETSEKNSTISELAECVFSVEEPLNLSNNAKFLEQNKPLQDYFDEPDDNLPLCVLHLDSEDLELVANDRFEVSVAADFSVIYRINPQESIKSGLEKGKKSLVQFIENVKTRQRNGTALIPFYVNGEAEIDANTPNGIDYNKTDSSVATATAKFVINRIKPEE